jgi:uncharacterized protein (TIGR03067 family)
MRTRTLLFTTLCAAANIAAGARADDPALTGDLAKLQGQWTAMFGPEKNIPLVITVKGIAVTLSITICNGGPGNERPTEFKAGEGGAPQLLVLNRKTTTTAAAGDLTGDQAKLQGRWSAKVGPEKNISIVLTIQGSSATLVIGAPNGQRESKGEIKIDETAKPQKTLDWVNFTNASGQTAPAPNLAIYKLAGDNLTICSGGLGNERPTEFKAGPENKNPSLIVLTRE